MRFFVIFSLFFSTYKCRNAILFFTSNKVIENFTFEVIPALDNNYTKWLAYTYFFKRNKMLEPLKIAQISSNETNYFYEDTFSNIEHEVIEILGAFKLRPEYVLIGNQSDVIEKLTTKSVDLVFNHPNFSNHPSIQQLYPIIRSNYLLIFKSNKLNFTKDIFILTFAGSLWFAFIIILIILAIFLRISTTQYSRISSKNELWSWVEITLWAIAAACQQGLSHTPSGFSSCLIFFLGYLMAYLLYTGFEAAITSVLVQQDTYYNFNLRDYKNLKMISLGQPNLDHHFLANIHANNVEMFFNKLNKKNVIGVGPEILINKYLQHKDPTKYVIKKLDIEYMDSFVTLRNNPKADILNKILIQMEEGGILKRLQNKMVKPVGVPVIESSYSSAGREHVFSAILLFLGGVGMSLIFLWFEWMVWLYKKSREELGL